MDFRDRLLVRLSHVLNQLIFPRKPPFTNSNTSRYWTIEEISVYHVPLQMAV